MVVIALILSVLLGFLAVAIDGGNNFLQRRRMQNAADGAAVAGVVEMATGTGNESAVCSVIREYAVTRGGADSDQVTMYYTPGDVPIQCQSQAVPDWANGVRVVVGHQFPSFVARIIGRSSFNVVADATAQYGAASSVVGSSPLAIADFDIRHDMEYTIWGHDCTQHSDHGGYHDDAYQGTHHGGHDGADCDLENGNIAGANFALLDLSCEFPATCNTGDAQLMGWMRDGDRSHSVFEGSQLQGDPGGRYGWDEEHREPPRDVQHILGEAQVGQVLILPVYDVAYRYTTDPVCSDSPGNPQYDPGPHAGQCHNNPVYGQCGDGCDPDYATIVDSYTEDGAYNNKYYYHVVSFAAFKVTEVHDHGDDKYIRGEFVPHVAQGNMGGTQDNGVIIIKLTQ
jgi:Flp pilus assembly protein TadG